MSNHCPCRSDERTAPLGQRSAFTLVELTIVLMILGILAAVAAPKFADSLHRFRAEAAARRVAADLARVQSYAQLVSASKTLSFTIGSNSYAAAGVPDLDQPSQTLYVDLGETPYPAVVASADFGGATSLSFNIYGAPSAAGTVVVQAGDYVRTVEVASTGAISVLP